MPIQSPDLDDLTYDRIRELLVRNISVYAPEWTNHNSSDPGIALIELFAWMTDQLGYRLNQVPDRAYVEFLQLIGVRLVPALPATTKLAFYVTKPELVPGRFAIPAGSTVKYANGDEPVFETDIEVDAVPAQLGALITTQSSDLRDLADPLDPLDDDDDADAWVDDRLAILWNGQDPKPQDLPGQPADMGQHGGDPTHTHLWLGFVFNDKPSAGFLGNRVTLTVQLDDDEQPDSAATVTCGATPEEAGDGPADYVWYRPRQLAEPEGTWIRLRILSDTTAGWSRSGEVTFEVPSALGPIPDDEWRPVRAPAPLTMKEICEAAEATPDEVPPEPIDHPLPGELKLSVAGMSLAVPMSGWIGVSFAGTTVPQVSIRAVSFNVAPATHARTVQAELLGRGDGRPGQSVSLAHGNVLDGTLQLAIEDLTDGLLHDWDEVEALDGSSADDRVYLLDREAGTLTFGDGIRGRPPALGHRIVALRYRHGGGAGADVPPGTVTETQRVPPDVTAASNLVAGRGGRDAQTLDEAKEIAPKALKVLERAVTVSDFEFLAEQTPTVNIARAHVVPTRRPLGGGALGLDLAENTKAPGALSVIVVPDREGLHPRPTAGEMREVCAWLDRHRLVTTEVHVAPPMYVRLFQWDIEVVAEPGYSTVQLRDALAADLESWLHVLTGDRGDGVPFGWTLPHSALVAHLLSTEGVARVDKLECWFDHRAPNLEDGTAGEVIGRAERGSAVRLTGCPGPTEADRIELRHDEVLFVDTATVNLEVNR